MDREEIVALKNQLATHGWEEAGNPWTWAKGTWQVVFDTSTWLELYIGKVRSHDVPTPTTEELAVWTVNHIEYMLDLEQRLLDLS